ncbi:MAG: DUF4386 domain-containing protein [Bacteroidota bacterium]|nr:DUF4386 domain-containing protein [Bacteroidota bacterium]
MTHRRSARIAGVLYLVVICAGMFSLAFVPKQLITWNNSSTTFANIRNAPYLFRAGLYSSVLCYITFVFLPLFLYRLLSSINAFRAKTMVLLALLSVALAFANLQHYNEALLFTGTAGALPHMPRPEAEQQLLLSLQFYAEGLSLVSVFWGLWLFPFGLLVYQSGFIPRILGMLLMLGCVGYLINFTGNLFLENYSSLKMGKYLGGLPALAELSICAWLLFGPVQQKNI